jgi:hypothetical protein
MDSLKFKFVLLKVILPLLLGLFLYLVFRKNTFINSLFNFGLNIEFSVKPIDYFLKFLLPDGLFAFSFTSAFLILWLKEFSLKYLLFPIGFFIIIEYLQLSKVIAGTFDFLDIIVMILFSLFSFNLLAKKRRLLCPIEV